MNGFQLSKGFKVAVFVLTVGWLSVLSVNIISPSSIHTSVFDADGNLVNDEFVLSEEDLQKINELKASWSIEDANSNAKLRAEKAVEAYNLGDSENAIQLYNEALALGKFENGNNITILMNLALAYESIGDSVGAIRTYRIVQSKVKPTGAEFSVAKGKIALLGEFMDVKTAMLAFKAAILLEPSNFEANNTLALIYMGEYGSEFKDLQEALKLNSKMKDIAPENTNVRINLAMNFLELGQVKYALEHLEYVLSVQPQSLPANYLMMKALHLRKESAKAKGYAEKLIGWYPDFKEDELVAEVMGK